MFDEVHFLFHFNIILNATGCPLLKKLSSSLLTKRHVNTDDVSFLEQKIFLKIYEHLSEAKRKIEVMKQKVFLIKDTVQVIFTQK